MTDDRGEPRTMRGLRPAAVLFDFDGTLAHSEPVITASIVRALASEGFEVAPEAVAPIFGPPLPVMFELLVGPLNAEQIERMRAAYFADFYAHLGDIEPLPGAEALLDALDAEGVRLAMVTNKGIESATKQLEAMRWEKRFATLIGADSVPLPKPAPDPAIEALRRLGVAREQAAFVGDQDPDMGCGRAAGIPVVIGYAHARPASELREAGATHIVTSLGEVAELLLGVAI